MLSIFVLFDFRATCIEMVTSLAYTHHGRQYLAQEGVIEQISNIIVGADSDPFSGFYLPGESSSSNILSYPALRPSCFLYKTPPSAVQ